MYPVLSGAAKSCTVKVKGKQVKDLCDRVTVREERQPSCHCGYGIIPVVKMIPDLREGGCSADARARKPAGYEGTGGFAAGSRGIDRTIYSMCWFYGAFFREEKGPFLVLKFIRKGVKSK